MNDLFCDIGYYSLNKDGETLCGQGLPYEKNAE